MNRKIAYTITFLRPVEEGDLKAERLNVGTLVPHKQIMMLDPELDLMEQINSQNKQNFQIENVETLNDFKAKRSIVDKIVNGN